MSGKTRLAAAFAVLAGLTAASAALAQTQPASAAPPPAPQASAPPAQASPPWDQMGTATVQPWDQDNGQKTYAVDPPPDGASGVYLPAAVLGYAKSAAGCVVIGCDDGPQAGGDSASPATGPSEPPPSASPGPADRR